MSGKLDSERLPSSPKEGGIVELSLMLTRNQFDALEERAYHEGLSVAQFLRRLVYESTQQDPAFA
jgi:hypothetical protein